MKIKRIISGGQTGADRGGLDAAIQWGIEHGGSCPSGRKAEDGTIPAKYNLHELPALSYLARTERNILDSDITLLLTTGPATGGSKHTTRICRKHKKPYLHIDLAQADHGQAADDILEYLKSYFGPNGTQQIIVNIAGNRESKSPGIQEQVRAVILSVLKVLQPLTYRIQRESPWLINRRSKSDLRGFGDEQQENVK